MDVNGLKIELLKKIIACKDEAVLKEIEVLLQEQQKEALEPDESYKLKSSEAAVPEHVYAELEEEFKAIEEGNIETQSWDKVNRELRDKYGF
ncbi:hypothetical protein SAMN05444483_10253 [Salegentibacter echinorum]|uniref:Addiction module component n=1 Tax=Salegentibacter echinorum TaxID=1073325 RepID=A0A1M5DP75_SALEC|nr:hypothetical protein [Salegentibacter echinorum]SHF68809.1 hypothetical protein SAMN05444483_10253 [Salegentibacter echinorum]